MESSLKYFDRIASKIERIYLFVCLFVLFPQSVQKHSPRPPLEVHDEGSADRQVSSRGSDREGHHGLVDAPARLPTAPGSKVKQRDRSPNPGQFLFLGLKGFS